MKDGTKVRLDMVDMNMRTQLAPETRGQRTYLPPACTTLSRSEKASFFGCLKGVKVPYGFSSNISSLVSMTDLKLIGLKSHDCHTLMQQLLPFAIKGKLPPKVRAAVQKLCVIFNSLCAKVIDPTELDTLQDQIVVTLCQLEMYFPPSFFNIMVHLTIREVKILGPVHMRWMYLFKWYMKIIKGYARTRNRREGSIVDGYVAEEAIEFCTNYLGNTSLVGIPRPRHFDRFHGKGTIDHRITTVPFKELNMAHFYVLQHIPEITPFIERHLTMLRITYRGKPEQWVQKEHQKSFVSWLKTNGVADDCTDTSSDNNDFIRWLSIGPRPNVHSYRAHDINGFCFYTKSQDDRSVVQNSSVTLLAEALEIEIQNRLLLTIMELLKKYGNWIHTFVCPSLNVNGLTILLYEWMRFGKTFVDFRRECYKDELFTMASQARQVFYVEDPSVKHKFIVVDSALS